jgi:hypothetical protein
MGKVSFTIASHIVSAHERAREPEVGASVKRVLEKAFFRGQKCGLVDQVKDKNGHVPHPLSMTRISDLFSARLLSSPLPGDSACRRRRCGDPFDYHVASGGTATAQWNAGPKGSDPSAGHQPLPCNRHV